MTIYFASKQVDLHVHGWSAIKIQTEHKEMDNTETFWTSLKMQKLIQILLHKENANSTTTGHNSVVKTFLIPVYGHIHV